MLRHGVVRDIVQRGLEWLLPRRDDAMSQIQYVFEDMLGRQAPQGRASPRKLTASSVTQCLRMEKLPKEWRGAVLSMLSPKEAIKATRTSTTMAKTPLTSDRLVLDASCRPWKNDAKDWKTLDNVLGAYRGVKTLVLDDFFGVINDVRQLEDVKQHFAPLINRASGLEIHQRWSRMNEVDTKEQGDRKVWQALLPSPCTHLVFRGRSAPCAFASAVQVLEENKGLTTLGSGKLISDTQLVSLWQALPRVVVPLRRLELRVEVTRADSLLFQVLSLCRGLEHVHLDVDTHDHIRLVEWFRWLEALDTTSLRVIECKSAISRPTTEEEMEKFALLSRFTVLERLEWDVQMVPRDGEIDENKLILTALQKLPLRHVRFGDQTELIDYLDDMMDMWPQLESFSSTTAPPPHFGTLGRTWQRFADKHPSLTHLSGGMFVNTSEQLTELKPLPWRHLALHMAELHAKAPLAAFLRTSTPGLTHLRIDDWEGVVDGEVANALPGTLVYLSCGRVDWTVQDMIDMAKRCRDLEMFWTTGEEKSRPVFLLAASSTGYDVCSDCFCYKPMIASRAPTLCALL
jgi:hypothetical protein